MTPQRNDTITVAEAKFQAQALMARIAHLRDEKQPFTLGRALEAVAQLHGYTDWNTLSGLAKKREPVLADFPAIPKATIRSRDGKLEREFSALGYAKTVTVEQLHELFRGNWSTCQAADDIAYACMGEMAVKQAFDHLDEANDGAPGAVGFDVRIDPLPLLAWMKLNRLYTYAEFLARVAGGAVKVKEGAPGEFHWLLGLRKSPAPLPSREAAYADLVTRQKLETSLAYWGFAPLAAAPHQKEPTR